MIIEFEEKMLNMIDELYSTATEDELFAGGYLRGHISLSAADCEEQGITDVDVLKQRIEASLHETRSELSPKDRQIVQQVWQDLLRRG
ncbi:YfcL family protein [Vibrio palustris]|uniref:YfcL protein n=1 Tax=Vibrio palustris TaxID=1918946 RepID=A0A1R4B0B2_9VIBR|nr:YfcL family protein [Vibrio palustris]SJL82358.1 YfcL protein [Vibrio palustris]